MTRAYAKGRSPLKPGQMNKTEDEYAQYLELQKRAGNVLWYGFERIKLRLAKNTFYTPDFMVMKDDRTLELHEVKGYWEDDARVKIKVAAETFQMFRFWAVQKKTKKQGGGWKWEEF